MIGRTRENLKGVTAQTTSIGGTETDLFAKGRHNEISE
jgi:hypothetical protein